MGVRRRARGARAVVLAALGLAASSVVGITPAEAGGSGSRAPVAVLAPPQEGAVPDLGAAGWVKVFNDDFDQGTLDESVWNVRDDNWGGWNSRNAVRIENDPGQPGDGMLTLTTYTEGGRHYKGIVQTGTASFGGNQRDADFTSAYGYVEARVKLNVAPKTWNAFWLLPSNADHSAPLGDTWGAGPEIDIFETPNEFEGDGTGPSPEGSGPDGKCDWQTLRVPCKEIAGGTLHTGGFGEDHGPVSWSTHWDTDPPVSLPSPYGNFINYGLLWTPDGYRMYRNGIEVFHSEEALSYAPEQIILSQHLNEWNHPDYGSLATSPYKMEVDYVNVWQRPISEIPNQTVAANSTVAIPFSVTDYISHGTNATTAEPALGSVTVSAASNTPSVVRSEQIVVTGDGPTTPQGTWQNRSFEGMTGWTPSGAEPATSDTAKKRTGNSSLRLTKGGSRAQQNITGLQPNTTYVLGGFDNIEVDWTDTNGNGKVDPNEPIADGEAFYNFGVTDVDATQAGNQSASVMRFRSASHEANDGTSSLPTEWRGTQVNFTTGPTTTSVTAYVDNIPYAGTGSNSRLWFDDITIRPLVPANRTVTVRPVNNAAGTTQITLTATLRRPDGTAIKTATESFNLSFTRSGSFTNGDFEAQPLGKGWQLYGSATGDGAEIVVDNPFTLDRALELAGPAHQPEAAKRANGTVIQKITGLVANQAYDLEVTGRGNLAAVVHDPNGNTLASLPITSATDITDDTSFTTGPGVTSVNLLLLDWTTAEVSVIDEVKVTPDVAAGNGTPTVVSPTLAQLHNQARTIPTAAPHSIGFTAPDGTTITSVKSSNQLVLPDRNVGGRVYDPSGSNNLVGVLSITPLGNQTGTANVTVTYGPGTQTAVIPVTVVDGHLRNPGFEPDSAGWTGGTIVGGGLQSKGAGAVELNGTGTVTQRVSGLPHNTPYVLKAATKGGVNVQVTTVPDEKMKGADGTPFPSFIETFTASWSGGSWTENQMNLATTQCPGCRLAGSIDRYARGNPPVEYLTMMPGGTFDVTFSDANTGDGQPVYVDDLRLLPTPRLHPIPEMSIASTDTSFGLWSGKSHFGVGRVPMNARFDPAAAALSSSDTTVVPTANLALAATDPLGGHKWTLQARAVSPVKTGRSNVTLTLTDPSGITRSETAPVTVNAGNNFRNGDFSRGSEGWTDGWFNLGWNITERQQWRHLGPNDTDSVLRISSGVTAHKVTGLVAGETYVLQANALGNKSKVEVFANTVDACNDAPSAGTFCLYIAGQSRGSVAIDRTTWGAVKTAANQDFQFTTIAEDPLKPGNQTDVWIVVRDDDMGDGPDVGTEMDDPPYKVPQSARHCAVFADGETCIDDIGIFRLADM